MEKIRNLFGETVKRIDAPPKRDRSTERGDLMKYFMDRLNPYRRQDGFPPLTYPRMGRILQGLTERDLYYLKSRCEDAKSFSKTFWYLLDAKKHQQNS
jgi:hypothetical protein